VLPSSAVFLTRFTCANVGRGDLMFSSLHSATQQQLDCSPSQCSTRGHHHHHHEVERKHMEKKNEEKESLDIHKVPKRKSPEHSET
jgi:hypothetical protein